jgi:uncharacterized protein (TIGR03067 family)
MRRIVLLGLVAALSCGVSTAEEKKADFDVKKLVGDWTYVSGTKSGEILPKDHLVGTVTFTKDTVTVPAGPDAKFLMEFKIDAKASPATIDLNIKDGPVKEGKAIGIIAVEGDLLKIAYVPAEGDAKRPTKFESAKDSGVLFLTLKKTK